jgi:hypothetical protein
VLTDVSVSWDIRDRVGRLSQTADAWLVWTDRQHVKKNHFKLHGFTFLDNRNKQVEGPHFIPKPEILDDI